MLGWSDGRRAGEVEGLDFKCVEGKTLSLGSILTDAHILLNANFLPLCLCFTWPDTFLSLAIDSWILHMATVRLPNYTQIEW